MIALGIVVVAVFTTLVIIEAKSNKKKCCKNGKDIFCDIEKGC